MQEKVIEPSELRNKNNIKSLLRGFNIIEELADENLVSITELATKLDMPKSSVHVYLNTMVEAGYVVKEGRQYRLSFKVLELGGNLRQQLNFFQASRKPLQSLANETGEVSALMIEENGMGIFLDRAESTNSIYDNVYIGENFYLHCTALGKALLSTYFDERVIRIIERRGLPQFTSKTITNVQELFEELNTISESNISINNEERKIGIRAVATPIVFEHEGPVGAITVSGPTARLTEKRMGTEICDKLLETKNIIELKIDHY